MHPFNNLHRPRGGPGSHTRDIHSKFKRSDKRNTKVRLASQILSYGFSQDTRFHWILFQGTRILHAIRFVGHRAPRKVIRPVRHRAPRRAIRPIGHQTPSGTILFS